MFNLKEDTIIKAMKKLIPFEEVAQIGGMMDLDEEEGSEDAEENKQKKVEENKNDDEKNRKDNMDNAVASIERDLV
jgi:hypothetical protein